MDFLTDWGVIIALLCAGCALIYGVVTSRWLLALSPGNQEMQDISTAVQEGAKAYLRRQYTIIAGVAVVLAIVLAVALEAQDAEGILVAIGFLIGGTFSGAAGFIGMNVSVRANARVAESARSGVSRALEVAFKGGAITGMLVVGLGLLGVGGFFWYVTGVSNVEPEAEYHEQHGANDGNGRVLPVQVSLRALLDGSGNFLHARIAGGSAEYPLDGNRPVGNPDDRANEREDQC